MPTDATQTDAMPATATERALRGLDRAMYFMDRGLAPSNKVRAFQRAAEIVAELDPSELEARCAQGTLTELDGIGPSTGSVIADSVAERPSDYLAKLDQSSVQTATIGAELRSRLRGDLHCHTTWSDGGSSVEVMARTAMALGHDYMVITDHSPRLTIAHGLSPERLAQQRVEIEALNEQLAPFRILRGMEVDILVDGALDLPEADLAELDIVVASVHSKLSMPEAEMTRRMVLAVSSPHVDILGHCTGRKVVGTGRPASKFDAELVFAACAAANTAVEINCRPERQDPPEELLALALDWNCFLSIDTDAHAPGQMEWQVSGCDKAVAAGADPDRIINTWDADRLLSWAAAGASR